MKKSMKLIYTTLVLLLATSVFAQTGKIKGKVVDGQTGDGLPGANVIVEGTMTGAAADMEGNFIINGVPVGTYSVMATMMGYGKQKVTNLFVVENQIVEANFVLSLEIIMGSEVVVEADPLTNTEAALLKNRQKSVFL